jgi:hypothetical protein
VEYESFATRGTAKKKKSKVKNEDDATPSMVQIEQDEYDPIYMDTNWDKLARRDGE